MAQKNQLAVKTRFVLLVFFRILTFNFTRKLSEFWLRYSWRDTTTLSGQVQIKMAKDRSLHLVKFADKVLVREYVRERVGKKYLAKHFFVGATASELPWNELPREFVLKVNHGCGGNIIVWEGAPETSVIPENFRKHGWGHYVVSPESFEPSRACEVANYWLTLDYSWNLGRRFPEWVYGEIRPQVFIEELLKNDDGSLPNDYKFFCFNGKVAMVQVDLERMTSHKRVLLTPEWKQIPTRYTYPLPDALPEPPPNLSEMIFVAEKLSAGIDFVRVDLYSMGNRIVFGELTNFPDGGGIKFRPRWLDFELGRAMSGLSSTLSPQHSRLHHLKARFLGVGPWANRCIRL